MGSQDPKSIQQMLAAGMITKAQAAIMRAKLPKTKKPKQTTKAKSRKKLSGMDAIRARAIKKAKK